MLLTIQFFGCKIESNTTHITQNSVTHKTTQNDVVKNVNTKYYKFTADTTRNIEIKNFYIENAYKLNTNYIVVGIYSNEELNASNTDWGDRLLYLDKNKQIIFKSIGVSDLYGYVPKFYKNNSNDKIIIICFRSFEYHFGGDAFLLDNGIMKYLGNLNIEPYNMDKTLVDILEINELNDKTVFSFDSDSLVFDASRDSRIIKNTDVKYEYFNNTFKLLNLD